MAFGQTGPDGAGRAGGTHSYDALMLRAAGPRVMRPDPAYVAPQARRGARRAVEPCGAGRGGRVMSSSLGSIAHKFVIFIELRMDVSEL